MGRCLRQILLKALYVTLYYLEIGVAQLHSIMEIVLKSPLVNWFKPSVA